MASNNIARLGVVLGIDTAEFSADVNKVIVDKKRLEAEMKRSTQRALADAVELKYATEDYGKTLSKVQEVERNIALGRYQGAKDVAIEELRKRAAAYDANAASMKHFNTALTEQQKLQLTYQTTDLITQIASGQNAMIALLQQGGQLKDSMGGLGNMFRLLGTFITPVNVALVATAAAAASVAYGFIAGQKEANEFTKSLILTGNYANTTYDNVLALARGFRDELNISIGNAKDGMFALVSSGQFTEKSLGAVGRTVALLTELTGQDAKVVAEKLIPSLNGSASSAKKLNDTYHFLTIEQYKNIEALEKAGKQQEAIKATVDALNDSLERQKAPLGTVEQLWKSISNLFSEIKDKLLDIGRPETATQGIARLNKEISALMGERAETKTPFHIERIENIIKGKQQELAALNRQLLNEAEHAAKMQKETDKINKRAAAGGLGKELALNDEFRKLDIQNDIASRKMLATRLQEIDLDAEGKIRQARLEMDIKNRDERGENELQNARILGQKLTTIEIERLQQVRDYKRQLYAQEQSEAMAADEEQRDAFAKQVAAIQDATNAQVLSNKLQSESLELNNKKLQAQISMAGYTEKEVQLEMIRLDTEKKIADIRRAIAEGKLTETGGQFIIDEINRQRKLQETAAELGEKLKLVKDIASSVFSNMESAIENFVKTGKFSFKDFARSVIQDIIAIQMKAQATKLLGGLFSSFSFASRGASGAISMADAAELGGNPFKAAGGPVSAGQGYIVGEQGPEFFMPSGSGTIIPNHALAGGGSTVVNNFSISAIDTKSFEDRLLNSPNAVWAANQYASKSLAFTKGRA